MSAKTMGKDCSRAERNFVKSFYVSLWIVHIPSSMSIAAIRPYEPCSCQTMPVSMRYCHACIHSVSVLVSPSIRMIASCVLVGGNESFCCFIVIRMFLYVLSFLLTKCYPEKGSDTPYYPHTFAYSHKSPQSPVFV